MKENGKVLNHSKVLEKLYYNPKIPGSFSGLNSFQKYLKQNKINIKKNDVLDWFQDQESYTLHKPVKKKFLRNQIIVYGIDDTWQADLIDLQSLSKENQGFKYLLTVIDVFSKFAWVRPLLNKNNAALISAFESIFKKSLRKPKRLHTDDGKEFTGSSFQKFLQLNEILFFSLHSEMKASVVERFNRTLKEKMWRYFTWKHKYVYYDVLEEFVDAYNNSFHRSIKMRPIDVKKTNQDNVFLNLYGIKNKIYSPNKTNEIKVKFKIGEEVRLSKSKYHFEKGFTPNWTQEIFKISKIILKDNPVYKVEDFSGEEIKGVFYSQELQKVTNKDQIYKIEKIIKSRKTKSGEKEFFVKWLGYPPSYNSWVKNIVDLT